MSKSYIIDQVSWHTSVPGNNESREHIEARFRAVFQFLHHHGLLRPDVATPDPSSELPASFCLRSDDLTEFGLEVIKAGYDKWLGALDKGTPASRVAILENALRKVSARYAQQWVQGPTSPPSAGPRP